MTVIDKSDPDWWKGKCLGRIGYFPSKYCTKLAAGEKALQVTHNLQVSDGERGEMTLLRDQIVIQVSKINRLGFLLLKTLILCMKRNKFLCQKENKKKMEGISEKIDEMVSR